jgi:hypothetical protein
VLIVSLLILLFVQFVMYELFPHFTQQVEFNFILRGIWYWGPWALLGLWMLRYGRRTGIFRNGDTRLGTHRRPIAVVATLATLFIIWDVFVSAATDLMTYHAYATGFTARDGLIPSAPGFVRFTPLENACTDIGNSVSSTGEHIDCDYVQPMLTDRGFGYAAPITPSGIYNTYFGENPGFLVLDDSMAVQSDPRKRLLRLDEPQRIGQGMEWFDNLAYVLAKTDFFANFDTPHFLPLDPAQPKKLTLVIPKIKYGFLFRLPYWGGNVLVHPDGKVEDLDAEQVKKDPRLIGKWVYPVSLARRYVHLQNYAAGHGLLTPFVRLSGLFEIETLSSGNQFPLLTQGGDGRPYLVTATKGQGSAQGLFRMYFTDASNGAGSYHEFDPHEVVYGAGASLKRVNNIQGYQWYDGKSAGVAIAIEPVYIVRPDEPATLRWKYTITNVNHTGVSATAVVNAARPDDIQVFHQRAEFEAWLRGADVPAAASPGSVATAPSSPGGDRARLLRMIDDLRKEVEKLPN